MVSEVVLFCWSTEPVRADLAKRTDVFSDIRCTWFQSKMAENMPHVRPPKTLVISSGNPAHSWRKWKQKFDIYLKATGASTKPDEMKVGLLFNHIGESCLEIYSNFTYLPERDDSAGGEERDSQPKVAITTRPS